MLNIALWVAIGMFIGWNIEQPAYAKTMQKWIVARWKNLTNNK